MVPDECAACGNVTTKRCSRCKTVRYCSAQCQTSDWNSGHKLRCKVGKKSTFSEIALCLDSNPILKPAQVLFPYQEFVQYFNWKKPLLCDPLGLNNCGNTCFANVVLQCLSWTRPLVAYLVETGHKRTCRRRRNNWCFFCEFETHLERVTKSLYPFAPTDIVSKLPSIGGNFGHGSQEDAHELMRFAIDKMQSVCLDEFGGEKMVPPRAQETTLIQYIFGGLFQSQVQCTVCSNMSVRYENMMDLTVEIHGEAVESLEECLEQYTAIEWLEGDNKYKCDRCNDYVKACKRLSIRCAPNILTIALKRFQSGYFGKLNKNISFPETLELGPYMSSGGSEGSDVYKLYAVIVHLNRYNASFSGHYICYIKDFRGNWHKINDSMVEKVELEEVLSQCAYMLLYTRVQTRPSRLLRSEEIKDDKNTSVSLLCNGIIPHSEYRKETSTSLGLSSTVSEEGKEVEERINKESNPFIAMEHGRQEVTGEAKEDILVIDSESNPCIDMELDCGTDGQEKGANGKEEPRIEDLPVDSSCPDTTTSLDVLNEAYSSLMNGAYSSSKKRRFLYQDDRWC